jgi:hypothetical protein
MSTIVLLAIPSSSWRGDQGARQHRREILIDVVTSSWGGSGAVSAPLRWCPARSSAPSREAAAPPFPASVPSCFPAWRRRAIPRGTPAALSPTPSVLGILIPPSAIMILYSGWEGSLCGLFPRHGDPRVILTVLFAAINIGCSGRIRISSWRNPSRREEFSALVRKRTTRALPRSFFPCSSSGDLRWIHDPHRGGRPRHGLRVPVGGSSSTRAERAGVPEGPGGVRHHHGGHHGHALFRHDPSRLYIMEDLPGSCWPCCNPSRAARWGFSSW